MGHYLANLRDIEFCLFDLLEREKILGTSIYKDLDRETVMGMLEEVKRLAENDLAASFVEGDRAGVDFNVATGDVERFLSVGAGQIGLDCGDTTVENTNI